MTVVKYYNHNAITMCLTMPIVLAKIFLGLVFHIIRRFNINRVIIATNPSRL